MELNNIVTIYSNSLLQYIDTIRAHFDIVQSYDIIIDKIIIFDDNQYQIIIKITPSLHLQSLPLSQYLLI